MGHRGDVAGSASRCFQALPTSSKGEEAHQGLRFHLAIPQKQRPHTGGKMSGLEKSLTFWADLAPEMAGFGRK